MPVYARDPALRDRFRSTSVHATIAVDGLEQAPIPPGRPFALPDRAGARLLMLEPGAAADHLAGVHTGYAAAAGIVHRRDLWVSASGALVLDRLGGAGLHAIEVRWPLAVEQAGVRPAAPGEREELARLGRLAPRIPSLDLEHAVAISLGAAGALVLALGGPSGLALEIVPAPRSPGYAELRDGLAVRFSGRLACPLEIATAFLHVPARPAP